jgi:hypothetical protein
MRITLIAGISWLALLSIGYALIERHRAKFKLS